MISISCTSAAMMRMKSSTWRNPRSITEPPKLKWSRWRNTTEVMKDASVITKITAPDMPIAVPSRFETPRNGQMPRNLDRTKL